MDYKCHYVNWEGVGCDWRGRDFKDLKQHVAKAHRGYAERDPTARKPTRPQNFDPRRRSIQANQPPGNTRRSRSPQRSTFRGSNRLSPIRSRRPTSPTSPPSRAERPKAGNPDGSSSAPKRSVAVSPRQKGRLADASCQTDDKIGIDVATETEADTDGEQLFEAARSLRQAGGGCKVTQKTRHIIPPGMKITYQYESLHLPDGTVYTRITREEKRKNNEPRDA